MVYRCHFRSTSSRGAAEGGVSKNARWHPEPSGSEIDLAHQRVVAHRGGRAGGDDLPTIEHNDAIGVTEDDVHIVLGEEHADAALANDGRCQRHEIATL